MPVCARCKEEKAPELFAKDKRRKSGLASYCRECQRACVRASYAKDIESSRVRSRIKTREYYHRHRERVRESGRRTQRIRAWAAGLVAQARCRARKYGLAFDLTTEPVVDLFERQGGLCFWLGVPLVPSMVVRDPQRPSLDRLDCTKGYTRDNVVLASQFANMGRSNISVERMGDFVSLLTDTLQGRSALKKAA